MTQLRFFGVIFVSYAISFGCTSPTNEQPQSIRLINEAPMPIDTFGSKTHRCENIFGKQRIFSDTVYPNAPMRIEYMCDDSIVLDGEVYSKVVLYDSIFECKPLRGYLTKNSNQIKYLYYEHENKSAIFMDLNNQNGKQSRGMFPSVLFKGFKINQNKDTIWIYEAHGLSSCDNGRFYNLFFNKQGELIEIIREYNPQLL